MSLVSYIPCYGSIVDGRCKVCGQDDYAYCVDHNHHWARGNGAFGHLDQKGYLHPAVRTRIGTSLNHGEAMSGVPMILWCQCGERHIDLGPWAVKPHKIHACQYCGLVWQPALVPTVGVQFLPGFKNEND